MIGSQIAATLRDIPTIVQNTNTGHMLFQNKQSGQALARYAETQYHSRNIVYDFEMHDKGNGLFYLKASGHNAGIDHYYGRDIRPVRKDDSTHPNHLWRFDPAPSDPTRYYRIVNSATGSALDDYYGREIRSAAADEHPNHLWEVLPAKDGSCCQLINKATGQLLCYDASHKKIVSKPGKYTIDVGVYNTDFPITNSLEHASWKLVQHNNSEYHNLVSTVTGEAVDYYDGESFRFVSAPSGHPNHLWKLEPTKIGDDKVYFFIRNNATSRVLDHYYSKSLGGAGDSNASAPNPYHIWKIEDLSS